MASPHQKIKVLGIDKLKGEQPGTVSYRLRAERIESVNVKFKEASQMEHIAFFEENIGNEVFVSLRMGALDNGDHWFNFDGDGDPFSRSAPQVKIVDKSTGEVLDPPLEAKKSLVNDPLKKMALNT